MFVKATCLCMSCLFWFPTAYASSDVMLTSGLLTFLFYIKVFFLLLAIAYRRKYFFKNVVVVVSILLLLLLLLLLFSFVVYVVYL